MAREDEEALVGVALGAPHVEESRVGQRQVEVEVALEEGASRQEHAQIS
jgi:hypothetical protein